MQRQQRLWWRKLLASPHANAWQLHSPWPCADATNKANCKHIIAQRRGSPAISPVVLLGGWAKPSSGCGVDPAPRIGVNSIYGVNRIDDCPERITWTVAPQLPSAPRVVTQSWIPGAMRCCFAALRRACAEFAPSHKMHATDLTCIGGCREGGDLLHALCQEV